jgi:hypothetical protein
MQNFAFFAIFREIRFLGGRRYENGISCASRKSQKCNFPKILEVSRFREFWQKFGFSDVPVETLNFVQPAKICNFSKNYDFRDLSRFLAKIQFSGVPVKRPTFHATLKNAIFPNFADFLRF